ncbi:alpha/beta fold hydrolase [Cohnella sp. REN36]|uniref:alpha/beta fold hydrolase n=1 Tax=Cohnella sp. REN36 TaxID=2887347 RepID=UPI001D13BFDC|nr:alpha/beta fold hydrolase [Cohnella sp. REN36]MCC3377416.1 alpha/beta hydrolase [Cohnella sp. REN36]
MASNVLFIQGAGEGAYEADRQLVSNLQQLLGDGYRIHFPRMPDESRPNGEAWIAQIRIDLSAYPGATILIGHSFGASMLLKYVSEGKPDHSVAGLFLLAPPYWGPEGWDVEAFALRSDAASAISDIQPVTFYHCRDDDIVPFSHLGQYVKTFPQAIVREFEGRGHLFGEDMSEVAQDIRNLQ